MILFPNFLAGLEAAPPEVLEAARGMGLTPNQILWKVEVPLARPAMIGGLRIAVVSTVAIATIAASIGENTLGAPIFYAIQLPTPFKTEIYSAGFLAVALALLCDAALVLTRRFTIPWTRAAAVIFDQANAHTFVEALRFIVDNPHLLITKAIEQLELSGAALGLALAVALPLGIVLGHLHRGSGIAIGTSIVGRALPSIFLIAVFLTILGLGFTNNMVALAVLALGPILTNAYLGVEGVDRDAVEAARGMGLSGRGILTRIELPLALPLLYIGIRIAAVTVVATAPIAAYAGGGGLGDIIANQATYRLSGVLGASICVMALSAGTWVLLLALQRVTTPRGVRAVRVQAQAGELRKEGL